jgi:hypothetical protein
MTGEVIGKGGNVTFAGRRLQKYLEEKKSTPCTYWSPPLIPTTGPTKILWRL